MVSEESSSASAGFIYFSRLPSEIREQIWLESLPEKDTPALFLYYRKRHWVPRIGTEHLEGDVEDLYLEFHYELLDWTQVRLPLGSVSREARGVALQWARRNGIEKRSYAGGVTFARPFDREQDTLFVPQDAFIDYISERPDRGFEPDLYEKIHTLCDSLRRIAISEPLLKEGDDILQDLFEVFFHMGEIFIVIDAPSDLKAKGKDTVQRRWELKETDRRAFRWNPREHVFKAKDGGNVEGNPFYALIKGSGRHLDHLRTEFEIRCVVAEKA